MQGIKERIHMLQEKVKQLLNEQINKELYSAYLYLDIANYYTCLLYTSISVDLTAGRREIER